MSNRLSKVDFFVVFMILVSLACLIGGFFLGANIGKSQAEKEFNRYLADRNEQILDFSGSLNYAHTDFVSFYHQVYIPFKEFRSSYLDFEQTARLSNQTVQELAQSNDIRPVIKELIKEMEEASIPHTSPLLQESYKEYILALQAFERGFNQLFSSKSENSQTIYSFIEDEQNFIAGKKHWLTGQSLFYEALVLWESLFVTNQNPKLIENPANYTLDQWAQLSFHHKNELIAKLLAELQVISIYNPEDVTVYLDSLHNHREDNSYMVAEALQFLIASDSIKKGQFLEKKNNYASLDLPMIPLFSN